MPVNQPQKGVPIDCSPAQRVDLVPTILVGRRPKAGEEEVKLKRDTADIQMAIVFRIDRFVSLPKVPIEYPLSHDMVHLQGTFYTFMKISQGYFFQKFSLCARVHLQFFFLKDH